MNKFFILSDALDYIESGLKSEMTQQEIADHCRRFGLCDPTAAYLLRQGTDFHQPKRLFDRF